MDHFLTLTGFSPRLLNKKFPSTTIENNPNISIEEDVPTISPTAAQICRPPDLFSCIDSLVGKGTMNIPVRSHQTMLVSLWFAFLFHIFSPGSFALLYSTKANEQHWPFRLFLQRGQWCMVTGSNWPTRDTFIREVADEQYDFSEGIGTRFVRFFLILVLRVLSTISLDRLLPSCLRL